MTYMSIVLTPKRSDIWLIDFDPAIGAEIRKVRPAVVVNVDTIGRLPLRIVVPVTDWKQQYASFPWFVELLASPTNGLLKDSGADCFQTKSVSKARFVRQVGEITTTELDEIAAAIALCVAYREPISAHPGGGVVIGAAGKNAALVILGKA
jgi:mRNA interferase MazF